MIIITRLHLVLLALISLEHPQRPMSNNGREGKQANILEDVHEGIVGCSGYLGC